MKGTGGKNANLFFGRRSPWRDGSSLRTIYTTLHSGTPPCHCSADTNSRDGRDPNIRSTKRKAKGRLGFPAGDTAQGCVFASRIDSRCRQRRDQSWVSFRRCRRDPRCSPVVELLDNPWPSARPGDMRSMWCALVAPLCVSIVGHRTTWLCLQPLW